MAEKSAEASSSEAASPQDERPSGNWWDSWITSAKSKSAEVYTMVKKDLDEIGSAVKSEASHVLSSTSNVIGKTLKLENPESTANAMKKSFSTFIGQVSTVLNPEPDDEDDTEVILSSGDTTMLSTYKKELEALQRVDATFIVPAYSPEFEAWRGSLENAEAVISAASAVKRLDSNPVLKTQYRRLVPDAVSHDEFWERYLFRVALLQDRLAAASRKTPSDEPTPADPVMDHLPLQSQASTPIQQSPKKVLSGLESDKSYENSDIENVVVTWEDEDFANDVELTEEQQILLLEEYEKEISTKKTKSPRDFANNNVNQQTSTTQSKTKSAQTRDLMNNKPEKKTTNKNGGQKKTQQTIDNKNGGQKKTQPTIDSKNGGQKKTQQTADNKNGGQKKTENKNGGKKVKSPKKQDVCGNDLVEDYFGENAKEDDSNSDESWEKEFEIDDVEQKA